VEELRPALAPGTQALSRTGPAAQRALVSVEAPRDEALSVEVLLSLGLARADDWPTLAELQATVSACGTNPFKVFAEAGGEVAVDEAVFIGLPLFASQADPSGYDRPGEFRRWVFQVFSAFPLAPGPVSLRRVLSFLALQPTVHESLTVAATLAGRDLAAPMTVQEFSDFLCQDGLRPPTAEPPILPEELVQLFRDVITAQPVEDPGVVTTPARERPPVYEVDLLQGTFEGGLASVLSHPKLADLPLDKQWTRPQYF
jgi:hypothetical protein